LRGFDGEIDVVAGVARIVQQSGPLPPRDRRNLSKLDFPTSRSSSLPSSRSS
jgi:hypothetical protein